MFMRISNYNNVNYASTFKQVVPNITNTAALNASIIGRIHTAKPGCSSCGRKAS